MELLFNKPMPNNKYLVFIKGKVLVDLELSFDDNLKVKILKLQDDGSRIVKFYKNNIELDFISLIDILNNIGHLPLPIIYKEMMKNQMR